MLKVQQFILVSTLILMPMASIAESDHERARKAVQSGQILPLQEILQKVSKDHPGQVLEVELDQEKGGWVYEIKQLTSAGSIVKLEVDAKTGQVLKQKIKKD